MSVSDVLGMFRKIPELASQARMAMNAADPEYQKFKAVYNKSAVVLGLPTVATGKLSENIQQMTLNFVGSLSRARSKGLSLNKAIADTVSAGLKGETIMDTVNRAYNNPTYAAKKPVFNQVTKELGEWQDEKMVMDLTDLKGQLPIFSADSRIMASNGGTIDLYPIFDTTGTVGGPLYAVSGLGGLANLGLVPMGLNVTVNTAATQSLWSKTHLGRRSCSVLFWLDGTNALAVQPNIQVVIPAGVPSGRLRIIGTRCAVSSISYNNLGAGPDIAQYGGLVTTGSTVTFGDASSTYWTWSAADGNEEYAHSVYVSKSRSASKTITLKLNATTTAACYFNCVFDVEYYPVNTRLRDLLVMPVDIALTDPIARAFEIMILYMDYCSNNNMTTILSSLNSRLKTSYTIDVLYPQNWSTYAFDNEDDFLEELLMLYQVYRKMLLQDVRFLEEM